MNLGEDWTHNLTTPEPQLKKQGWVLICVSLWLFQIITPDLYSYHTYLYLWYKTQLYQHRIL